MFKKALGVALLFSMLCSLAACGAAGQQDAEARDVSENSSYESVEGTQIKMITENTEVVITLNDSRAAADLAAMLPLEMTLIERNRFAKGMTLPEHGSMAIFKGILQCRKHTRWGKASVDIDYYNKIKEQNSMKRLTAILLSALLVLSLAACGNSDRNTVENTPAETEVTTPITEFNGSSTEESAVEPTDDETENAETSDTAEAGSGNILIAYFSVMETDGVDTVAGASRVAVNGEVLGNNEYIAQLIQRETGGDLFAIETVQDYPTTHDPLLEFAYNEKADNARPELAAQIENPDSYDVIFLGYPNWNADLPMPLYTFLEEYDFSGKTIIPFTTHGGSGFSRTIQTISELQPDATVISDGLSISRNSVSGAEGDVVNWVNGLNLTTE
ncbi:MAG: flavodoxin [Roseburia sp.]|nr:flavodoxin [Roseburia sp.]